MYPLSSNWTEFCDSVWRLVCFFLSH